MAHIIQNFDTLAENELRRDALHIAEAGYAAINVDTALRNKVQMAGDEMRIGDKKYALAGRRIFFIGIGKCALVAAQAIETLLGDRLTGGIAFDVSAIPERKLSKIEPIIGTHPLPSEENVHGTERVLALLSDLCEEDLVITVISGGGSTLLCAPQAPMTSADEAALFRELTAHGAPIQDLNIVRKHSSRARGGGLARAAYPAEVISLIISDVPGNDPAFISSGPTVLDSSTVADAERVFAKYGVTPAEPISLLETPKEEKYFARVNNVLFLTNRDALSAMLIEAMRLGYTTEIVDDHFSGEARDISRTIVEKLHTAQAKTAFLYAGESTVSLGDSSSVGGRNQEIALAALENVRADELILPFASDGHDNTDSAGAIGDATSAVHAAAHNLSIENYLSAHRSYEFFSTTGDALVTGYTGSNVSDLIIALKK